MSNLRNLAIAIALLACVVPSFAQEGTETGVELDDGDLLILNMLATSVNPVGESEMAFWETAEGDTQTIMSQMVEITIFDGQMLAAKVECSHSGCTGPVCSATGCVPSGTGCTPAKCTKENGENCTEKPKCSKKVTAQ